MDSYLNDAELNAIQGMDRSTPYLIDGVSQTQLSIARFYGACKFQGREYTYFPATDELIRDDVLKFVTKMRKDAARRLK